MKTTAILSALLLSSLSVFSQSKISLTPYYQGPLLDNSLSKEALSPSKKVWSKPESSSGQTLWQEDFGQGLSGTNGTWTITGQNANLVGIDTDGPDNLIANGYGPIASPSAANGFINFDWYNKRNEPLGFSTTPTQAILTSPVINLSANDTLIELAFHQEIYHCCNFDWTAVVEISTDGGLSFPNEVDITWVSRNDDARDFDLGTEFTYDISEYIKADPTNVVLRFNWTSLVADANGQFASNYFWMLDDIQLNELPQHEIRFTEIPFINSNNQPHEVPKQDMVFDAGNNPVHARYGILHYDQIVPIEFDCNIFNYGTATQVNVALEVDILDANNSLLQTLTSAGATLNYKDTVDFNTFTTPAWLPQSTGTYRVVYKAISDSIGFGNSPGLAPTDTFTLRITDNSYSLDFGQIDNFTGTDESANDMVGMALKFDLDNEDPDSAGANLVFLDGVEMYLSLLCDTTADLEFSLFDTAQFTVGNGFSGSPVYSKVINLSGKGSNLGGLVDFDFRESALLYNASTQTFDTVLRPISVPTGTYYLAVLFFTNQVDGVIRFANDQSFAQPSSASLFLDNNGSWFAGFTESRSFESPIVRLQMGEAPPFNIGLTDIDLNSFSVYPNPSKGMGTLSFSKKGSYAIKVLNLSGQAVFNAMYQVRNNEQTLLNLQHLPAGVYLINIQGEGLKSTTKLILQ